MTLYRRSCGRTKANPESWGRSSKELLHPAQLLKILSWTQHCEQHWLKPSYFCQLHISPRLSYWLTCTYTDTHNTHAHTPLPVTQAHFICAARASPEGLLGGGVTPTPRQRRAKGPQSHHMSVFTFLVRGFSRGCTAKVQRTAWTITEKVRSALLPAPALPR